MKHLHPKVVELRKRSLPINHSLQPIIERKLMVRADGKLVEGEGTGSGYLIVWGVRNSYGEVWLKGSCAKSIAEHGPDSASNQKIAFLWQHRMDEPIGRFTKMMEDDYGLYVEWEYDPFDAVPRARQASAQVKSGTINQMSVGFNYVWDKIEYREADDSLIIKEAEIGEGSLVTLGSCEETEARSAADADYDAEYASLMEETEEVITCLPPRRRMEVRDIITRHITLSRSRQDQSTKPLELVTDDTDKSAKKIDYNYLTNNL